MIEPYKTDTFPSTFKFRFDVDSVNQALGPLALELYKFGHIIQATWDNRAVHMLRRSIAKRFGTSVAKISHALKLLSEANLHYYEGWQVEPIKNTLIKNKGKPNIGYVPRRKFLKLSKNSVYWIAPSDLIHWAEGRLLKRKNWGGARISKKKIAQLWDQALQSLVKPFFSDLAAKIVKKISSSPAYELLLFSKSNRYHSTTYYGTYDSALSGANLNHFKIIMQGNPITQAHRQKILELGKRLIPPYPGLDLIPAVSLPPPARLAVEASYVERVKLLGAAFRSTFTQRYKIACNFLVIPDEKLENHRSFSKLTVISDLFIEYGLPPVAWCLFSLDVWRRYNPSTYAKSSWVYSANRIRDRQSWFGESFDLAYCSSAVDYCFQHRKLMADWVAMYHEILQVREPTRDVIARIVDAYFPGNTWENRVELAKQEAGRAQNRLLHARVQGDSVWGR